MNRIRGYRLYLLLLLGLGAQAANGLGAGKAFLFDLGSRKSAVRPGFARIAPDTLYSAGQGYGWVKPDKLVAQDRHFPAEWVYNKHRKRSQPPPVYTNEITRDAIISEKPNTLRVDLPDGAYELYLICGVSDRGPGSRYRWEFFDFTLSAGSLKARIFWPGTQWFHKRAYRVEVKGGSLEIRLQPASLFAVNALCLLPAGDAGSFKQKILAPMEEEIFFLPPKVRAKWKEIPHVETRAMPELSARDKERGFAVWSRHYMELVYPNTVPLRTELNPQLKLFASLGEFEPVTFTLRPFRDFAAVRVAATGLSGPAGAIIPASSIEVRWVRYVNVRPNYQVYFKYTLTPDILMPYRDLSLKSNVNQRYWLTVHVPDDAKPGIYQGNIEITADSAVTVKVPLKLRVLPIRLKNDPDKRWGCYYRDAFQRYLTIKFKDRVSREFWLRRSRFEIENLREHGMNTYVGVSVNTAITKWGDRRAKNLATRCYPAEWDFGRLDKLIRHYLESGFKPPIVAYLPVGWMYRLAMGKNMGSHGVDLRMPPDEFFPLVTRMVSLVEAERAKRGWPVILYYPLDEPNRSKLMVKFLGRVFAAIRAGGGKVYVTADPAHKEFEPWRKVVDVWCCQPFTFPRDEVLRRQEEDRCEFWCYPNNTSGENNHTVRAGARMTYGFGFWRSGFRALVPWIFASTGGNPFDCTDSTYSDFMNRTAPDGSVIPVAAWECYREGIDDYRYAYTLKTLTEKLKQSRDRKVLRAVSEAEQDLQFVWNTIPVMKRYKYEVPWKSGEFEVYRWILARQILRLQELAR